MGFALSPRSLANLDQVHPDLVRVVRRAIEITQVDFGVIEGVRSVEDQRQYVAAGRSQTMHSKHLIQPDGYGHAVDLMAYHNGRGCWEIALYDDIADAMAQAAREEQTGLRWGGAWQIANITRYHGTMAEANQAYIDLRTSEGRRPFIDGPHFEQVGS